MKFETAWSCESSLVACEMKKPKVRSPARSTGADAELSVEQPRNLSSSGGCDVAEINLHVGGPLELRHERLRGLAVEGRFEQVFRVVGHSAPLRENCRRLS